MVYESIYSDILVHHGIKGQKWGVRRYQNSDGTLTDAGRKRLSKNEAYRDKLANKSKRKADSSREKSKDASAKVKDLEENGTR